MATTKHDTKISIETFNGMNLQDYEGYLWYSDAESPWIIPHDLQDVQLHAGDLPFVTEGQLYSRKNNISLRIRHFNGAYHIYRFELYNWQDKTHRKPRQWTIPGSEKLQHKTHTFCQLQVLQPDRQGWNVWQTVAAVFTGFED